MGATFRIVSELKFLLGLTWDDELDMNVMEDLDVKMIAVWNTIAAVGKLVKSITTSNSFWAGLKTKAGCITIK